MRVGIEGRRHPRNGSFEREGEILSKTANLSGRGRDAEERSGAGVGIEGRRHPRNGSFERESGTVEDSNLSSRGRDTEERSGAEH